MSLGHASPDTVTVAVAPLLARVIVVVAPGVVVADEGVPNALEGTPVGGGAFSDGGTDTPGVIEFDGNETSPVPSELDAVTVKVYEVPFKRPVTVQVSAVVVAQD